VTDSPPTGADLRRTSRDLEQLRFALQGWLGQRLPPGADPKIPSLTTSAATGMSSETVLFPATWTGEHGAVHTEDLVCRIAPDPEDVPVFPSYDMRGQFEVIKLVGELTSVPVPKVRWLEEDTSLLGTPFFLMDRVDGTAPPDNPPYTFGSNWLADASDEQRGVMERSTIDVLAELHDIAGAERRFGFLFTPAEQAAGPTPLHRKVARTRSWYDWTVAGGVRSPLVERGFAWLEEHWPSDPGATVLSWGDSRVGNVLYRDFLPVAVLDWEMAAVCPREVDLGWLIYGHRIFQDMAAAYELPGVPGLLERDAVTAYYEAKTGYTPRELDFYLAYSALQYAIVFLRTGSRAVHFGEAAMPEDPDELLFNREPLERMLVGTYWS
jgi:aminoglycoside phosphotransferase (APT) family kinase protein